MQYYHCDERLLRFLFYKNIILFLYYSIILSHSDSTNVMTPIRLLDNAHGETKFNYT